MVVSEGEDRVGVQRKRGGGEEMRYVWLWSNEG